MSSENMYYLVISSCGFVAFFALALVIYLSLDKKNKR